MKKLFLLLAMLLGLATPAHASCGVSFVPMVGVFCDIARNPSYTASSVALVPASSATDLFCISPGTTKTISIRRITISGTAGTAITTPFLIYRRVSLDTGGTAATGTALPIPVPMSTTDVASTATLTAYTANPTVVDSSPSLMDDILVDLPVTTAAGGATAPFRSYGTSVDFFQKGLDLARNTTQQVCVNPNGVSISTGVLQITMEWQEN